MPLLFYRHQTHNPPKDYFARTWTLVMQYLDGMVQHQNLGMQQARVMMEGLARFHAYFWGKTEGEHTPIDR